MTETLIKYRNRLESEEMDAHTGGAHRLHAQADDFNVLCQELVNEFTGQELYHERLVYVCQAESTTGSFDKRLMRQAYTAE